MPGLKKVRRSLSILANIFPKEDVRSDVLLPSSHTSQSPTKGEASYFTVKVGDKVAKDAAWAYRKIIPNIDALKDYVAFEWDKMDAWFEESEEVFVHPRDPYKRIDVQQSSRHVRVVVAGETVAESDNPVLLFETGLPTRYYSRKVDILPSIISQRKMFARMSCYHPAIRANPQLKVRLRTSP